MIFLTQDAATVFAHGTLTSELDTNGGKELPAAQLHLYYFHEIKLEPPVVFQHLAGAPLRTWLDHCYLVEETEGAEMAIPTGPLRYVHGRSEVMKGKHYISAVLLAYVQYDGELPEGRWLSAIPSIYGQFTRVLNTGLPKNLDY